MKLKRGLSKFWAFMYRSGFAKPRMPFWRVVVEAKLDRRARDWPAKYDAVVVPVYAWARTIEEAEGLAALALEAEGVKPLTADAVKCAPAAGPRRQPTAVARGEWGFLAKPEDETRRAGSSHRDARA